MANPTSQSPADPVSDGAVKQSIPVEIDSIGLLPKSFISSFKELVQRVDALEQTQKDRDADLRKDPDTQQAAIVSESPVDETHDTDSVKGEQKLRSYVEFRKEVWKDDIAGFTWIVDTEANKETLSNKKPFQYDTSRSGRLRFTVFRSAKVYEKLREFCPPEHDGQVKSLEEGLVFEDAFPLLHCRDQLLKYRMDLGDDSACNAVREELDVFETLYKREGHLMDAQQQYRDLVEKKQIEFKSLQGLFKKDGLVVFRELRDEWAVARITRVVGTGISWDRYDEPRSEFELECNTIDFDGKNFRFHSYRKSIDLFIGIRYITELPVYPLEFCKDKQRIINVSIKSGAKWWRLHTLFTNQAQPTQKDAVVMQYDGYCETFDEGEDSQDGEGRRGNQLVSRVIVDPTKFPDRLLRFIEDEQDLAGFDPDAPFQGKPEDNPLILCPEKVLVHSLSDNEWYYVAMTRLKEPTWAQNAWARLVKPDSGDIARSITRIQLLAEAHKKSKEIDDDGQGMDNFKGKGKGLTFLLHGPPGVGKTMLAECLSEEHHRPLYRVNLGRLVGDDNWESIIDEIFRQAYLWDAILLVDEAEVILAERTQENMRQSAWVAVFLRKIEYFEGVIFLTTNLIHMIDPAFISRVNLGIRIPSLNHETRSRIWQKMLGDLPKSNTAIWATRKDGIPRDWADKDLNGRQIRNVIQSACLLAPSTGEVTKENIENALQDVVNFMGMIEEEKKDVELGHMSHWS